MRMLSLLLVVLAPCHAWMASGADLDSRSAARPTFTVWQLPEQTRSQMMSYVLRTVGGKLIVIDGGTKGDSPYLRGFLAALGNRVEAWFISHPHSDHVDALTEILSRPQGLKIGTVYASLPDPAWIAEFAPPGEGPSVQRFREALKAARQPAVELSLGQTLTIDGIEIEVLGVKNPEITVNCFNNSSVVVKVRDKAKSILFLGDLGVEGGQKLLRGPSAAKLRAEYVQMAHHGQNGVGEDVYRAIQPTRCLWPTPRWLWDNDSGKGKGSGRWRTLEVRAWLDKLPIQRHFVSAEGPHQID